MLTIWQITMRSLSFNPKDRHSHSKHFAVNTRNEREAVEFAKTHIFTPIWWDSFLITDIVPIGELWAAEGLVVPQDED